GSALSFSRCPTGQQPGSRVRAAGSAPFSFFTGVSRSHGVIFVMASKIRVGVLGASGYTGADLVRLGLRHEAMEIVLLTANTYAGKPMAEVFPHLGFAKLPDLVTVEDADWGAVDAVFCGLPHGTTQEIATKVLGEHPE